jgi:hypothetical protein
LVPFWSRVIQQPPSVVLFLRTGEVVGSIPTALTIEIK